MVTQGFLPRSLVQLDDHEHSAHRQVANDWFKPAAVKNRQPRIDEIADHFIAKMREMGGECDFAADIAQPYTLHVIMDIYGIPEEDEPLMMDLTQGIFGANDPEFLGDAVDPQQRAIQSVMTFIQYFNGITAERRACPTDDLATVIANGQVDGCPMGDAERLWYFIIVATAGHDTTSSSTAGAMWALAQNPKELAKVKADLSLIPTLVEESIRWTTPVKTFMRTATADTEFAGRQMKKGDWLMLCYASGNRDEAVFEAPQTFLADRKPNKQLAFGYGAHLCLGQHLAKMEMRILWEELLPRLSDLALDGEPAMSQSTFVNGPKRLPIRFRMD
jgi:cytochrome P450